MPPVELFVFIHEFVAALNEVVVRYPNDSVKYKAQEILDYIKHINNPQDTTALMDTSTVGPVFLYEPDSTHSYVLVFPNQGVDLNLIKTRFSNFNTEYFSLADLKTFYFNCNISIVKSVKIS